jgi:uncharacterized protein DUF4349
MNERSWRGPIIVVALVVVFIAAPVAVLINGGRTSTILSMVGAAIPPTTGGADPAGGKPATTGDQSTSATGNALANAAIQLPTLLIVRTGSLDLEVTSIPAVTASANDIVAAAGGFVSESKETGVAEAGAATATYRIPAAAWDRTLSGLRGLATVRGQQVQTEEVTGKAIDLRARITNLRATEGALQAIMSRASKISDVLDVQRQLTDTRGQIEELTAQQVQLEDRAAYGSLTVTFRLPAVPPTIAPVAGWDPASDVAQATGKLVRIGQRATSTGIWFAIVGIPILVGGLVLAIVAWQLYRLTRWLLRRRWAGEAAAG